MSGLNESQKRFIHICFQDIHRHMAQMEAWLAEGAAAGPFSEHVSDLSPTEKKVIQDYFARIRTTMLACLRESQIPLEVQQTSLRWAMQCTMTFINITVAEMDAKRLAGYGGLTETGAAVVRKIQQDLERLVDRAKTYLRLGMGWNLQERLQRLEATGENRATLILLDEIITRWQLVEFRPLLDMIIGRLETPRFEVAVFGRVSSGKSSLLNHIAGQDVLPVGVTPITAVPTRLFRGDKPQVVVAFAELSPREVPLGELRDYASEEGNPGNEKHVTAIQVQVPAQRLREGVVFVDTPGTGSLALEGGAETLAYLPRCDLGIVLIDAASSLNEDDLVLLRALYEAGIPAQVLVSKADLLQADDRRRMIRYIGEQLGRQLGLELPVRCVSTVGIDEALLDDWFKRELEPLLDGHRSLVEASLQRKMASLRESVGAVLETLLAKRKGGEPGRAGAGRAIDLTVLGKLLAQGDRAVEDVKARCRDWPRDEPALREIIVRDAASGVVQVDGAGQSPVAEAIEKILDERSRQALRLAEDLKETLGRTMQALEQLMPLAAARRPPDAAAASLLALDVRGLPRHSLPSSADFPDTRPWLSALFPAWGMWKAQRNLRKRLGPAIGKQVESYDRQLQAWLKVCVEQLADLYEGQAEVYREQARRLAAPSDNSSAEALALAADLKRLGHQSGQAVAVDLPPSPT